MGLSTRAHLAHQDALRFKKCKPGAANAPRGIDVRLVQRLVVDYAQARRLGNSARAQELQASLNAAGFDVIDTLKGTVLRPVQ